jgi:hypothetical protein
VGALAEVSVTGSGVAADGSWVPEFPGQRPPFQPGHLASVRHGAFSRRLTGPLAEQIAAEQLARPDCPLWLREPSYASAVLAWAYAEAECVRLRDRRDALEQLAGDNSVEDSLADVTESEERQEGLPSWGVITRVSVMRQRESLAKALHRAETRARSLRSDLGLTPASRARLGRDITAAGRVDLARYWADEDGREAAEAG